MLVCQLYIEWKRFLKSMNLTLCIVYDTIINVIFVQISLQFYPTSMRAMGLGACSGMARIGAIVTPFIAQVLLKESAYVAISLYGVMCMIAAVASLLLPYETKGREMQVEAL